MGLRFAAGEDLPKQWSMRNRTSRWLKNIQVSRADHPPKHDQDDSQHPFGDQAAAIWFRIEIRTIVALGFASQPYDWFAFSRMMTLQAR